MIVSTFGGEARKSLNQNFWDCLWRLLELRPEIYQIETHGIDFVDLWGQNHKVTKPKLLGMNLSISESDNTVLMVQELKF